MVRFEKDRYIIEIVTGCDPIESWIELQKSIQDLIRNVNRDTLSDNFFNSVDFLQELIPDWDIAKKMTT
jgi:hypothetical protein